MSAINATSSRQFSGHSLNSPTSEVSGDTESKTAQLTVAIAKLALALANLMSRSENVNSGSTQERGLDLAYSSPLFLEMSEHSRSSGFKDYGTRTKTSQQGREFKGRPRGRSNRRGSDASNV